MAHRYYHIATMGCQMNEYDSEHVGNILMESGFYPTENHNIADLILINTCTVREKAQQKAFSHIGRMLALKRRNPDLILGIMGCIAQQEGNNLLLRFPEIDLVMGTREIGKISQYINRIELTGEKIVATDLSIKPLYILDSYGERDRKVKSHVSIMEGCNNFCSYCIVPYVRGKEVSRNSTDIVNEVKHYISQGVKEITLVGQNVNSYYSSEGENINFPMLLEELDSLDGLYRIRFTTSHPKDLSDDLIGCFSRLEKLCPHIHLPFQAGSDRILDKMNRGYTRENYMELVQKLRVTQPEIAITSDVMVGFPGETAHDYEMTLDLIGKIEFDNLYSFMYSDRKGTLAEKMDEKIDENDKKSRLNRLQSIQKEITLRKNRNLIGKTIEILVDGESKKRTQLKGRSGTNKIINFNSDNSIIGKLVNVKIKDAFVNSLQAELI